MGVGGGLGGLGGVRCGAGRGTWGAGGADLWGLSMGPHGSLCCLYGTVYVLYESLWSLYGLCCLSTVYVSAWPLYGLPMYLCGLSMVSLWSVYLYGLYGLSMVSMVSMVSLCIFVVALWPLCVSLWRLYGLFPVSLWSLWSSYGLYMYFYGISMVSVCIPMVSLWSLYGRSMASLWSLWPLYGLPALYGSALQVQLPHEQHGSVPRDPPPLDLLALPGRRPRSAPCRLPQRRAHRPLHGAVRYGPIDGGSCPIDWGPCPIDWGSYPIDVGSCPIDGGPCPIDGGSCPIDGGL